MSTYGYGRKILTCLIYTNPPFSLIFIQLLPFLRLPHIKSTQYKKLAPNAWRFTHYRGVSGYLKLGGQVVMWRAAAAARAFYSSKIGWAIARPAHPALTPLY